MGLPFPRGLVATLAVATLGCGGLSQLSGQHYVFPPKKILKGAIAAKVTGAGMDTLTATIGDLLPALLGTNANGWACLNADALLASGAISVPLSLGPLKANVGARNVDLCFDFQSLKVEFVEGSDPATLRLSVDHAKVALQSPMVVFGDADLVLANPDAACVLGNQLGEGTAQPYLAEVSFVADVTLDVDEDGKFTLTTTLGALTIHDIGVTIAQDCAQPECSDANPLNLFDPCVECGVCSAADFGSDIFEFLNGVIGQLLDPLLAGLLNAITGPLLDALLNGKPLDISAAVTLSNVLGGITDSARTTSDLGLLVRPAPNGFSVSGTGATKGLDVRLEGGSVGLPVHACAGEVGDEPEIASGPWPEMTGILDDGRTYELAAGVSEAFLNQALWSLYTAGGLCLGLTTRELSALTKGGLNLRAGALDLLVPGIAALAGRDGSVRIRILPDLVASDFPLVDVAPSGTDALAGVRLRHFGVAIEAFVDGGYMRVMTVTADVDLQLGVAIVPPSTVHATVAQLQLANVSVSGTEAVAAARLEDVVALGVEVAVMVLGGIDPFGLDVDTANLTEMLGNLPIALEFVEVAPAGVDRDWLAAYLHIAPAPAEKPHAPPDIALVAPIEDGVVRLRVPGAGVARVDGLVWRALVPSGPGEATLSHPALLLLGEHRIEVAIGRSTVIVDARVESPPPAAPASPPEPEPGCSSGTRGSGAVVVFVALAVLALRRRRLAVLLLVLGACSQSRDLAVDCRTHADCPAGYTCETAAGRCIAETPCGSDSECCPGLSCFHGGCRELQECGASDECLADDTTCDAGRCVAKPCAQPMDCAGADSRCLGGRCLATPACGGCPPGTVCEPAGGRCVVATPECAALSCPSGTTLLVGNHDALVGPACRLFDMVCGCAGLPSLPPALPSGWLDLVELADGRRVVVARDMRYGDLVALTLDADGVLGKPVVLDGRPAGPVVGDVNGPRGGVAEPGPDVGRHASATAFGAGFAVVAQDITRGALRVILGAPDGATAAYDLDAEEASGFGASLAAGDDGSLYVSWFTVAPDGTESLRVARVPPGDSPGPAAWTRVVVANDSGTLEADAPCDGACGPLQVCVSAAAEPPACAVADLVAGCEPPCDRDALCVAGACARRVERNAGVRAWRDAPGGESRLAIAGGALILPWHDHRRGALRLSLGPAEGPFTAYTLTGGHGDDVGHHLALATGPSGQVAIAYQDASRGTLALHSGPSAQALTPSDVERGGVGIDLAFRADGTMVLAHGAIDGSGVRLAVGAPGAWTFVDALSPGHVGRFNALASIGATATLVTIRDALAKDLAPAPVLETRMVPLP